MSEFRFKRFSVRNELSSMKVNTDGVLLGAAVTLEPAPLSVLDIGSGTGTIALMLAQRLEGRCRIDAVEIDAPSAAEATENFAASPWAGSLSLHHCALQEYMPECEYDLIVTNPPYYDASLKNPDDRKAAARHSDSLSFDEIALFAQEHLGSAGRLAMVLPSDSLNALLRTARSRSLYPYRLLSVRTTARKAPRRVIAEFSRSRCETMQEVLCIMEEGRYTDRYIALLKDFYLNF